MIENFVPIYPIIVGGQVSYLLKNVLELSMSVLNDEDGIQGTCKNISILLYSLWVGNDSKVSLPVYSFDDHSIRMATLLSIFPVNLPNAGFCTFNSLSANTLRFRVTVTGVVLDVNRSTKIVRKLKLTGVHDFQEYGFYYEDQDMFSGVLEGAKFEGANVRTVFGISCQIKNALSKPDGAFGAVFEDKVLSKAVSDFSLALKKIKSN